MKYTPFTKPQSGNDQRLTKFSFQRLRGTPFFRGWLLVISLGLVVCIPIFLYGIPWSGDLAHHYRSAQCFYDSIVRGDLYPSWLSFSNGGYGDPSVRFYPPALSYLLSGFRLLTGDWYLASVFALTLLTIVGGLGMFVWARTLTVERYAVMASLLYLLAPFHASEMFQAGMFAQYACACVLPFVFAFIERTISRGRWSDVVGLGVSYGLFVLCNLPLVVLGSIAVGVYALVRLIQSFGKRSVYQLVAGSLSGLALSSFYWLPMLFEIKWKSPSGAGQGAWFDYKNNFIFRPSPNESGDWWVSIMIFVTLLMAVPALVLLAKRQRKHLAPALVALFSFLMATPLSKPVWDALPVLQETQFPWRWLTITAACLSLLVALSLPELIRMWQTRLRPLSFALIGITVIGLSFTVLQVMRSALFQDRQTFDRTVAALRDSETNRDFFPVWASDKPQKMDQPVEDAGRDVHVTIWSEKQKEFKIETKDATEVRLRAFYYPYWIATAEGKQLATRPASDGALLVHIPPTATTVRVEFIEPTCTRVAGAISLLGLLAMPLLLLRAKSADVLAGVDETANHAAIVPSVLIHNTNPI